MTRFRFVHAADLHLDTPFHGIRRTASSIAEAIRDASLDAWDSLVRLTIERDATFLLIAGDIYDGAERGVRAQLRFYKGLERLAGHGIETFIVHGNHDPLDGWSAIKQWPHGVTVFGPRDVDKVDVSRGGERLATVYGISYGQRDVTENLSLRFRAGSEPGIHIGLLHCNVGGQPDHAAYSPCSLDDLVQADLDYWALGHIHRRQILRDRHPLVVYPGSLQGRSTAAGEDGPKGAFVVEVEQGRMTPSFVPLDRVRFVKDEVDLSDCRDLPAVHQLLVERGADLRVAHEGRSLLMRGVLRGRSEVHHDLQRSGVLDEMLKGLRRKGEGLEPFLWWDSLVDRTTGDIDREAVRRRGDFSAELLRISDQLRSDPHALMALTTDGEAFRRLRLEEPGDPAVDATSLLAEAEQLALDLLEED